MQEVVRKQFGDRVRVRVCGLLIEQERVLLVGHRAIGAEGFLWAPPGGGLQFGETLEQALQREFVEETGLAVEVGDFLFVHEFLQPPLHGIELFYEVRRQGGTLCKGQDPELEQGSQLISEVRFMSFEELGGLPAAQLHNAFTYCQDVESLRSMRGMYHFFG